jgi:outer membrane protein
VIVFALFAATATSANAAPVTLTLEDAVAEALVKTRGVIHAKADLLLADVDKMRALSPILPKFDLQITAQENFQGPLISEQRGGPRTLEDLLNLQRTGIVQPGPFTDTNIANSSNPTFSLQLTGQQLIYDGGRWWLVIGQANDLEREKRAALAVVENDTRLNVARLFWELEKAQRALATVGEQVDVDLAQLARAKAMLEAGVSKLSDVAQAERNLATDRIALTQQESIARSTKRQLSLAIGRSSADEIEISVPEEPLPTDELPPRNELVTTALEARPDLVRTRASLDAIRKNVGIAAAAHYPSVGLFANYSKQSRRPDRVFNDPTENYVAALGLSLQWNLFNGRLTTSEVERAEIELTKLEATYEEQQRIASADVEERLERLIYAYRIFKLSVDSIRAGEEAVRLARGLYAEGRATALELRDAELALTQQKLSEIQARIDVEIALEELRRAVGGELSWPKKPG